MIPERPTALPSRGNVVTRVLASGLLRLCGWRFEGSLPNEPKQVIIVAPHTSNWDFIIGILAVFALGIKANWIGKHTLFKAPFSGAMSWLGGIPVNRAVPNDLVKSTTERFQNTGKMLLGLAPEGTRKPVEQWKKGFHRIAHAAGVPVSCAAIDYRRKTLIFGPSFRVTGDYEVDITAIRDFYSDITARKPDSFTLP